MSYVTVDGSDTYYETHGSGDPLVLLHGGLGNAEHFAGLVPRLAERYRVIVPERRGHGRTPDVEGRLTYRLMAAETVAFLEALGVSAASLVGWSDGAMVAALVAIDRPDLVEKLVLIGQYFDPSGARPEALALLRDDSPLGGWARESHDRLSPDGPEHFDVFLAKVLRMWREDTGIASGELSRITAPTLVMQGDDDFVRVEHSASVVATVAEGQLAVVPGASHGLPLEQPDLVVRLVLSFLGGEHPVKLLPLG